MRARPGHSIRDLLRRRQNRTPYPYQPLPSTSAIRLLQVHPPTIDDEIHCSLKVFEPAKAPPYHAISYTWGYPLTPFSSLSKTSSFRQLGFLRNLAATSPDSLLEDGKPLQTEQEIGNDARCFPIKCDGRTMLVTANLHDALRKLRGMGAGFLKDAFDPHPRERAQEDNDGSQYFWIDAVCVDQANIAERNAQVAMMARTFHAARGVVVWLGMEDQFTADALKLIEAISTLPRATRDLTRYTDFFDPEWQACAGKLTYQHWLGFLALLDRPWFRRAWVVQELALARDALLICGSRTVSWAHLESVLDFVRSKRWYHHLSVEKISHLDAVAKNPGPYAKLLQSSTSFSMRAINLSRTRQWLSRKTGNLGILTQMHRETEATDPRDKVYAFIGLTDERLNSFHKAGTPNTGGVRGIGGPIRPDYKLPVQDVYTDVSRRFMLSHGDLRMLSQVQDSGDTKIRDLPSWVPDYSVALRPYYLFIRGMVDWNASGALVWTPNVGALERGHLHVQGIRVGVIRETAQTSSEAATSAQYWAGVIRVAASLDDYHHPVPGPEGFSRSGTPQTRVEVFWRTLITNTYSRQHPAPPSVGTLVLDYSLNVQIRQALAPWSNVEFMPHLSPTNPALEATARTAWPSLLAAEPEGSPYSRDVYRERISSVVEGMLCGNYKPLGLAQLHHEFDIASGSMRRVFSTARDDVHGGGILLGTGPRSLRQGDEVWVLAGAQVPMVLRRASGEAGEGRYSLVGEAYVHGAMYGAENGIQGRNDTHKRLINIVIE